MYSCGWLDKIFGRASTTKRSILTGRSHYPGFHSVRALAKFVQLQATVYHYVVLRSLEIQGLGRRKGCASVLKTQSSKLITSLGSENIR